MCLLWTFILKKLFDEEDKIAPSERGTIEVVTSSIDLGYADSVAFFR